jgi:hypothetical protein
MVKSASREQYNERELLTVEIICKIIDNTIKQ